LKQHGQKKKLSYFLSPNELSNTVLYLFLGLSGEKSGVWEVTGKMMYICCTCQLDWS